MISPTRFSPSLFSASRSPRPAPGRHRVRNRRITQAGALLAVAALVLGGLEVRMSEPAAAATTTTITLPASASVFTVTTAPTKNYSGVNALYVTQTAYKTFLKFDTSKITSAGTVVSAHLDLYTTRISSTVAGLQIHPTSSSWSATTLTAANRPAADTRVLNKLVLPKVNAVTAVGLTTLTTINKTGSTAFEIGYAAANPNIAMAKSGTDAPKLVVTYTTGSTTSTSSSSTTSKSSSSATSTSATTTTSQAPLSTTPSGSTFINLPAASTHKKLVFAHYYLPAPISFDNKPPASDYYAVNNLQPTGEKGKWSFAGGLFRDRPIPRDPISGNYKLIDLETEVKQASAAGIDGFTIDVLDFSGTNWTATLNLLTAAHIVNPNFKIIMELDMPGNLRVLDAATIAKYVAVMAAYPAEYHLSDGRLVMGAFSADSKTPAFWSSVMSILKSTYGISTAFLPMLLNTVNTFDSFAPISWAIGDWGVRNTNSVATRENLAAKAHAAGKLYMAPVAVQDSRPKNSIYDETGNTELLRAMWQQAIDQDADMVSMVSWNDLGENTGFQPSANHGWNFLDISDYYMAQFQTGNVPAIAQDALYITNRIQKYSAGWSYTPPAGSGYAPEQAMVWRSGSTNGNTKPRDTVEILTYLTASATINVRTGGTTYSYTAPAGEYAKLFPLQYGTITGSIVRSGTTIGTATSALPVVATPYVQDLSYYAVGSLRPNPRRS